MARMNKRQAKPEQEFEQRLIEVARVTRVMKGGKRMRFRALLAIGDRKGRVGIGQAKGADVSMAIQKAFHQAKKNLIMVPMVNGTILHEINKKYKASQIMLKPAKSGSGVKAGGAVRIILELSGIQDVTAKIKGSNNKTNNVKATLEALGEFKMTDETRKDLEKRKEALARKAATQRSDTRKPAGRRGPRKPMNGKPAAAKKPADKKPSAKKEATK